MTAVEEACWTTARHEVLHALYGTSCGWSIHWTRCRPSGQTSCDLPMALRRFYSNYRQHPARTIGMLRQICGFALAPYVILDAIPLEANPMAYALGTDLALLEQWRDRWACYSWMTTPPGPSWRRLCLDARHTVYAWYHDLGRAELVEQLATTLLDVGWIDGSTWERLVMYNISRHLKEKDKERRARIP
jgi:hypothetical protein